VPIIAGILFSIAAGTGALGHRFCARLLRHHSPRVVIAGAAALGAGGAMMYVFAPNAWLLLLGTPFFGVAIGIATTAAYTSASSVMPPTARGTGFGLLTTASLAGLAISPVVNGFLGATSIRAVFVLDAIGMLLLAAMVSRMMIATPLPETTTPAAEEM
jgi:MFS family permease